MRVITNNSHYKKRVRMKKLALLASILIIGFSNTAPAQSIFKRDVLFDVYYGYPSLYHVLQRALLESEFPDEDFNLVGVGPVGIRGEYMVAGRLGVGVDLAYSVLKLRATREDFIYDDATGNTTPVTYYLEGRSTKISAMATVNYHFLLKDNFDLNLNGGLGYGPRKYTEKTNDPTYTTQSDEGLIPISLKVGLQMHYYFTQNIGFNLGVTIGRGGLLNGGISFKI